MSAVFTDGDYTALKVNSLPKYEAPFEHTSDRYVFRQTYFQAQASRAATPLNTQHATLTDYFLVGESPETDLGEGVVEWERTYAKKPTNFTEPGGTHSYQFIGLAADFGQDIEPAAGRHPFERTVMSVVENEFFLVGTSGGGLATPDYATAEEIPLNEITEYVFELSPEDKTTYLVNSPPSNTPTIPTLDEYKDWRDDDAASVDSYTIIVLCTIERWMGNIYVRKTQRVKAI